jgi:formylglycine-generating enzyme required for sulfatase activity
LCHAFDDKPAVQVLYERLSAEDIDVWMAEERILPGQDWELEIQRAVSASDVVIVCLSRKSADKTGYVQKEIKLALDVADRQPEGAIFIVPAKLEDCKVPDRIMRWHWVNLYEKIGFVLLMRALEARAGTLGISFGRTRGATKSLEFTRQALKEVLSKTEPEPLTFSRGDRIEADRSKKNRPTVVVQKFASIEFVRVPKGKFVMGSREDNQFAIENERKQHTLDILYDYWISRYPVTNDQFGVFLKATRYKRELSRGWKKKRGHPVVSISWYDAMEYCKWLKEELLEEIRGSVVRLPSEAEWEKAARGEFGNEWPWGNNFDPQNCNSMEGHKGTTTPVGSYSPDGDSPYGAADMAGNVWEWCMTKWQDSYKDYRNDNSTEGGGYRVLRGGSFLDLAEAVRCPVRDFYIPGGWSKNVGFRVVISPL